MDAEKIGSAAKRFFRPNELQSFQTLDTKAMHTAFFRLWTRKEALLKAVGTGVAGGLYTYEISFLPNEKPQLLAPSDEANEWSLFYLEVEPESSGSLAVKAHNDFDFTVQQLNFESHLL